MGVLGKTLDHGDNRPGGLRLCPSQPCLADCPRPAITSMSFWGGCENRMATGWSHASLCHGVPVSQWPGECGLPSVFAGGGQWLAISGLSV